MIVFISIKKNKKKMLNFIFYDVLFFILGTMGGCPPSNIYFFKLLGKKYKK
jgi:hypothetical protein